MWFLYVVLCEKDNTFYCGTTTDLQRRLDAHNGLRPGGARYTKARRPVRLVAFLPQPSQSAALSAEIKFKRLTRAEKEKRIATWTFRQ